MFNAWSVCTVYVIRARGTEINSSSRIKLLCELKLSVKRLVILPVKMLNHFRPQYTTNLKQILNDLMIFFIVLIKVN